MPSVHLAQRGSQPPPGEEGRHAIGAGLLGGGAFGDPAAQGRAPEQEPSQAKGGPCSRIFSGLTSITVGFWGGSAALALASMSRSADFAFEAYAGSRWGAV